MLSKIVLGKEPWLSIALEDWRTIDPLVELKPIDIRLDKNFLFELPVLDNYLPDDFTVFVAWGPEFLNFQRLELFGEFKKRGFKMPPLIHPTSQVSSSAVIQENVWLHAFTYVGKNAVVEFNSTISIAAIIGSNVCIHRNAWIGRGVSIHDGAQIGGNTFLGEGITVFPDVIVGRQVKLDYPCNINSSVPDKNFHIQASNLCGKIIKI
jgi:acetyltransferase-like isoleucine patch superfamily enzyme